MREKLTSYLNQMKLNPKLVIKNIFLVLLGTFVLAFGTELFILPTNLVTGGVSGLAIALSNIITVLDKEVLITIITWVLFFLGLFFLGLDFSLKTLLSTIFYPIFLYVSKALVNVCPFLLLENAASLNSNAEMVILLSSLFGGVIVGAGCAITFLGGGSTGGVDIISFIFCKFVKGVKTSYCLFIVDALIVILGFILDKEHDIALSLEGIFSAFIVAIVIDKIFIGTSKTFVAYVISDKYEEITQEVIKTIDRTTSIIDIEGGYTKLPKKMVMISFSMHEYSIIMGIVSRIDKKAFMTIHRAHEIAGEGFKKMED